MGNGDENTIPAAQRLEIRPDGIVTHDGLSVGTYGDGDGSDVLVLNLGWFRLAGLSIRVEDDPLTDRHQSGLTLERLVEPRRRG